MFDLAYNGQASPVQVRVIGDRQGVPSRYLEQIFHRLRRADLVVSKRGPGGGYQLARPAAEISLREIVEALEGPLPESLCEGVAPPEDAAEPSTYRPDFVWAALGTGFGEVLASISLEALCRTAVRAAVPRAVSEPPSYVI